MSYRFNRLPSRPARLAAVVGLCFLAGAGLLLFSCQQPAEGPRGRSVPLAQTRSINDEPAVRVRIAANTSTITAGAETALLIGPAGNGESRSAMQQFQAPVRVTREAGYFILRTGDGSFRWAVPRLRLGASGNESLTIDNTTYPGNMVLVPLQYEGQETGRFDVVNHVGLERYLPGVIERELWPHWHAHAYEAQAIAARSYALFEQRLNRDRHYDLASTTASQVYGGAAKNPTAVAAVRDTRGQVVTHRGRVLPTFYSSCCGGTSQSASIAFAHLGEGVDLPPLRSRRRTAWCEPSKHHRWGPIRRDASHLAQRLARWGKANDHPIAALRDLGGIEIVDRTGAGRPSRFAVTDARGRRYALWAEQFRFACNYAVKGLPDLAFEHQLRSSHVQPHVRGRTVQFTDGRGWGHGVGMCQWGAQGMAEHGYEAQAILQHFYTGAQVQRLY